MRTRPDGQAGARPNLALTELKPGPDGLIPAVAQDARSGEVLMLGYMNREALQRTIASGEAWYWSRSRGRLWRKGETSGHTQQVQSVRVDCDGDALLLAVDQQGPACHTGHRSCFFRDAEGRLVPAAAAERDIFDRLFGLLRERRAKKPRGSYTAALLSSGPKTIGAKVREEARELARAADRESDRRVAEEAADLIYHAWVLLVARGVELDEVRRVLEERRRGR